MLGVELELVVVAHLEQIHNAPQCGHGRNLVPADIQHIPTLLKHSATCLRTGAQDQDGHAASLQDG